MKSKNLTEMFGEPIGSYAGDSPTGVRSEGSCSECGMMPAEIGGDCGCGCGSASNDVAEEMCSACGMPADQCMCKGSNICPSCGMMSLEPGAPCSCSMVNEAKKKKKGPSKKTAEKILGGTKSFAEKMRKVSGWAEDPAAAAAWMQHRATGKWPREK